MIRELKLASIVYAKKAATLGTSVPLVSNFFARVEHRLDDLYYEVYFGKRKQLK